jgi:hypothetical protein
MVNWSVIGRLHDPSISLAALFFKNLSYGVTITGMGIEQIEKGWKRHKKGKYPPSRPSGGLSFHTNS